MDFRREKLRLALAILVAGMAVAVVWHGTLAALGWPYPYNTFLFRPEVSHSDFTDFMKLVMPAGNYFPSAFLLFGPFRLLPAEVGVWVFLVSSVLGLFLMLRRVLRSLGLPRGEFWLTCLAFLGSYPMLLCLDRGNIEIFLALGVAGSLMLFSRRRFARSLGVLLPALCFKLYPGALLLLFARRGLWRWLLLGVLAFAVINPMLGWLVPQFVEISHTDNRFAYYLQYYVLGFFGVAASVDAWGLFRLGVWSVHSCLHGSFVWPLPMDVQLDALLVYCGLAAAGGTVLTGHVLLVETVAMRRAILLLLYMTVAVPVGSDYKLLHVGIALLTLILLPERRRGDLACVAALAICLLPKREILFTFMGVSGSSAPDGNIGIVLNPLCQLFAMLLLIRAGREMLKPGDISRRWQRIF